MPLSLVPSRLLDADRLTPADARLLELEERRGLPMHVGSVLVFAGPAPALAELTQHVRERLELVPRYRRRVVAVPLRQGRPVWADDPQLRLGYHVRAEALPGAADEAALARLASRVLSARLDRSKPLWELCLVEGLRPDGFALIVKSHETLVDGARNLDLAGALLDDLPAPAQAPPESPTPRPPPATGGYGGQAAPLPSQAQLLAGALAERAVDPREALETLRGLARRVREELDRRDLDPLARLGAPPPSPLRRRPGPYRRLVWVEAALEPLRAAKERLRGTVNDIVLAAVAGALGRYLREQGEDVSGVALRALIPVAGPEHPMQGAGRGPLLAAYAPLPLGIEDARRRHAEISRALDGLRDSGRAAGADELSALAGFAPASMIGAAARLQADHRAFDLMVTNVPGPQEPRYLLGRAMRSIYPVVPLGAMQALSISVISYDGRLCFGLLSDYDALADPERLAALLAEALGELAPGG